MIGQNAIVGLVFLLLAACMVAPAHAGDIYSCKDAQGHTSYQDTPCPNAAKTTSHVTYKPFAEPSPSASDVTWDDDAQGTPDNQQAAPQTNGAIPPAQPAPQQPVAWICRTTHRRWIQFSPCPPTYDEPKAVDVDGTTMAGEHVEGTGTVMIPVPVQSQPLDDDGACAALGDKSLRIPHHGSSDVYERNKLKSKFCGQ